MDISTNKQDKSVDSSTKCETPRVRPCGMPSGRIKLGETLRKLRGKTPRVVLADSSGVSAHTIQMLEEGETANPTMNTILALCGALKCSPIEFLKDAYPDLQEKPQQVIVQDSDAVSLKEIVSILDGFSKASPLKRAMVLTMLVPVRGHSLAYFQRAGISIDLETAQKFRELIEGMQTRE